MDNNIFINNQYYLVDISNSNIVVPLYNNRENDDTIVVKSSSGIANITINQGILYYDYHDEGDENIQMIIQELGDGNVPINDYTIDTVILESVIAGVTFTSTLFFIINEGDIIIPDTITICMTYTMNSVINLPQERDGYNFTYSILDGTIEVQYLYNNCCNAVIKDDQLTLIPKESGCSNTFTLRINITTPTSENYTLDIPVKTDVITKSTIEDFTYSDYSDRNKSHQSNKLLQSAYNDMVSFIQNNSTFNILDVPDINGSLVDVYEKIECARNLYKLNPNLNCVCDLYYKLNSILFFSY